MKKLGKILSVTGKCASVLVTVFVIIMVGLYFIAPDAFNAIVGLIKDIKSQDSEYVIVEFDPTVGELESAQKQKYVILHDKYGSIPEATKENADFLGWYDQYGNPINEDSIVEDVKDHTLTAKWGVTVTFEANGGVCDITSDKVVYGETYDTITNPKKENHIFLGWYTTDKPTGGTEIKEGAKVTKSEHHTLYARWAVEVIFDANGGDCNTVSKQVVCGSQYGNLPTPTKENYNFAGWFTEREGGERITENRISDVHHSQTLYAHWDTISCTVNLESFNSIFAKVSVTSGEAYGELPVPEIEGAEFLGWYTEPRGGSKIEANTKVTSLENHSLYARWGVMLSFDTNDGEATSIESYIVICDSRYGQLPVLSKEGAEFLGWYTTPTLETKVTSSSIVNEKTYHTLYAKWEYPYLDFKLTADDTYSIIGVDKNNIPCNIVIPKLYNGKQVTSIGSFAFKGYSSLTNVTIPDSVTSIGNGAFRDCDSLVSVVIPDSVTTIGEYAFYYCYSLTSVYITDLSNWCNISFGNSDSNPLHYAGNLYLNGELVTELVIPDDVTVINNYAFYNYDSLVSVVIPDSVTTIGEYAFYDCDSLTSITIPDSVISVGDSAFKDCDSLTSVVIGKTVTSIGFMAFCDCDSLASVTIPDSVTTIGRGAFSGTAYYNDESNWVNGVLYIGNHLIEAKDTISGEYLIKGGTITIANSAFSGCSSLTSITIPDSVRSIGESAFSNCSSLTKVTFGNNVTTIGDSAFYNCDSLASITIPDSVTTIGNLAFTDCSSLTTVTIGNNVTTIGSYAFSYCYRLSSITIPDSVTTIDFYAFLGCSSLTNVIIGNGVTSIGYRAFKDCSSLTTVTIGNNVTTIGDGAFYNCDSLTGVVIPNSVTSIFSSAFYDCDSLATVTIGNNVTSIGEDAFAGCSSLTSITIPDSVTSIGDGAFDGCNSLVSVVIGDSVTSIGDYAFEGCSSLTSITIPDSVTSIGNGAFYDCDSLASIITDKNNQNYKSINGNLYTKNGTTLVQYATGKKDTTFVIPNSVTTIGNYAFYNCDSLTSITIPDSVTSIGYSAFYSCNSLISITIPNSVTSIGSYAFSYCNSLASITIPDSVTTIGYRAFFRTAYYDNESNWVDGVLYIGNHLIDVKNTIYGEYVIKDGTVTIADSAFYGQYMLTNIVIPDSVTTIGDGAFRDCDSLTGVVIPNSVTSIGSSAFYRCDGLTSVVIGDDVTSIGDSAFEDCKKLTSITIPGSVEFIGSSAFYGTAYYNNGSNWVNGVLYIANHLIKAKDTISSEYVIKDGTVTIANYAFYNCNSLTSITIPDSVEFIGDYAFDDCLNLTDVYYTGTEEEWKGIEISDTGNSDLVNATIHYNYKP